MELLYHKTGFENVLTHHVFVGTMYGYVKYRGVVYSCTEGSIWARQYEITG